MPRRKQAVPAASTDETTLRVRNLIALDAAHLMRRLEARRGEMFILFSRLRSRAPMLETLATRYTSATFQELVHLPAREQSVVDHFYECLDTLRWYFTYTEDMPSTAQQTFITLHRRLEEAHRKLVTVLGPPAPHDGGAPARGDGTVVEGTVPPPRAGAPARWWRARWWKPRSCAARSPPPCPGRAAPPAPCLEELEGGRTGGPVAGWVGGLSLDSAPA